MSAPQERNKFLKRLVFGQYFNYQGIKMFIYTLLRDRRDFIPHVRVHCVSDINYNKLHSTGIRFVVFDKDNTLTKPYERHFFNDKIKRAVMQDCIKSFGPANVAILSNSAGSKDDVGYKEANEIETTMGLKVIRHEKKKPLIKEDVMNHFRCIEED